MIRGENLLKILFLTIVLFLVSVGIRLFTERNGSQSHTSIFSQQVRADAPGCGGCGEGGCAEGCGEGGGGPGGGGPGGGGPGGGSSCGDGSSGSGGSTW